MVAAVEYRCMSCSMELDETEFGDPRDADICGYCFAAKTTEIRHRNLPQPPGANDCGIWREIGFLADIEIRLENAMRRGDQKAVNIYEQMHRLISA